MHFRRCCTSDASCTHAVLCLAVHVAPGQADVLDAEEAGLLAAVQVAEHPAWREADVSWWCLHVHGPRAQ